MICLLNPKQLSENNMPLIIKRSWNPDDSEKRVLDHLKRLFKDGEIRIISGFIG